MSPFSCKTKTFYDNFLNVATLCDGKKHECISWISYAAEIKVLGQVTHVLQCLELDGRSRVRPNFFFDQVGHETMNASSGNKHFFTKSCHRQTYQNYEHSRQKLGTIVGNNVP